MKRYFIHFITLLIASNLIGQVTYFNNAYNYNNFSPALAVIEYEDDYIFSGVTYDSVNNSLSTYIACIDSTGGLKYWKTISDPEKYYWAGYVGSLTSIGDEGFIAAGTVNCHPDSSNGILYRFSTNGDTMWTKQYPDTLHSRYQLFHNCNTTEDNGYVMIGASSVAPYFTNFLLIKANSIGSEEWRKEYGTPGWIKHGYSVVQTPDKGYLLGYYQYVAGQDTSGDPVVMKVDSLGNFEWEKNIGGPTRDFFTQVSIGNDGSYIAGTSLSDSVSQDNHFSRIKIYKFSQSGEILWARNYCGIELDNKLYAIYPDQNGGYIATGHRSNYFHPGYWWNEYGWLLKIDENGDSAWYREYQYYSGTGDDYNKLYDLCLAPDGGYTMVGKVSTWTEPQTAWVMKVDSLGCDTPGCATGIYIPVPQAIENEALWLYPNPANAYLNCRLQSADYKCSMFIYDMFGRKQDEIRIPKGQKKIHIDVSAYPAGIYLAVLKNKKRILGRSKFVVK
jgi:hypothetical protein